MATIGGTALTLADWSKRMDDDGKVARIVNILSQTNEILGDMLWVEGNLPTGHKTTIRTGLPQAYWRLLNMGVPTGKSTTVQITDDCGMLETYSQLDKDLAELNGNSDEFRLSEDMAFLEGLNQQMATQLFYGNVQANPQGFNGLSVRYNSVNTANSQTANNVIDAGGTGSTNTSIWVVGWGPNTAHGIFPKGKLSGLQMRNLGEEPAYDGNGNQYRAMKTHFKWDAGMVVRDWRYAVRIANIDVTTLSGGTPPDLIKLLIRALHRLPTQPVSAGNVQTSDDPNGAVIVGKTAIYCNRAVGAWLDIQATNKTNVLLRLDEFDGKPVTRFRGVPVRTCDALLNTEARVV